MKKGVAINFFFSHKHHTKIAMQDEEEVMITIINEEKSLCKAQQ